MDVDAPLPTEVGRYRVRRSLGHGAMGRVLLARDPVLDRDVAVKLLRQDLSLAPGQFTTLLDRMRQEARASARVFHPNIVALFDMGEDPELGLYLVFEYVEGPTLRAQIEQGPLGPTRAAKISREVGGALAVAHAAGVLHRDIKPENVIIAASGAKIADFGIARIPGSTLTRDGGVLGTPAYSSPEAIDTGTFSPASDQFSFAAMMYEVLSGKRAFPGDDAVTVATRITSSEPEPIAEAAGLDPHVDRVLARALSKNPSQRYDSCEDLGRALAESLAITAARAALPTLPDEQRQVAAERDVERRELLAAAVGAAVGAAVVAALFLLWPAAPAAPAVAQGGAPSVRLTRTAAAPSAATASSPPRPAPRREQPAPPRQAANALASSSALPAPTADAASD